MDWEFELKNIECLFNVVVVIALIVSVLLGSLFIENYLPGNIKLVSAEEATSLTSKLISYWPFEEGGGDATADMNLARVIHLINGNWTDGKVGKAIRFSGNGENSEGISPYIKLGPKFSVSFWLKINDAGFTHWYKGPIMIGSTPLILENISLENISDSYGVRLLDVYNIFLVGWINNNTGMLGSFYTKQQYKHDSLANYPFGVLYSYTNKNDFNTDTSWHHIVTVFDVPNNISKIYVDGVLNADTYTTYGNTTLRDLTYKIILGRTSAADYILDELAIYNGILSDGEIQDVYQKGLNNEHLSEVQSDSPIYYLYYYVHERLDTNQDGKISLEELIIFISQDYTEEEKSIAINFWITS